MVRIIHIGLGEIGRNVVAALGRRGTHAELVAVVDANKELQGKRVRGVMGKAALGVPDLRVEGDDVTGWVGASAGTDPTV